MGRQCGTLIPAFVLAQILDGRGVQFDAAEFQWLVSTASSNSTVYVWSASNIRSVEDAMSRDVLMGGTGIGSYTTLYPTIMNNILGTRFKIIAGYPTSAEVGLAMQRGEVEGRAGNNFNSLEVENGDWLKNGTIRLIAQVGLERDRAFPDVPLISDFAKTDSERRILRLFSSDVVIGRPFLTSPGVPPERVALSRKAFGEMLEDKAFLDECAAAGVDVDPEPGDRIRRSWPICSHAARHHCQGQGGNDSQRHRRPQQVGVHGKMRSSICVRRSGSSALGRRDCFCRTCCILPASN